MQPARLPDRFGLRLQPPAPFPDSAGRIIQVFEDSCASNPGTTLGTGGMGEVYRARDTKLNRNVVLKVLFDAFATDQDRLARFKREAQAIASLNHPNIASIYGLEEGDGIRALVLELVEGLTLADRITEGPIPLDEALPVALQMA